MRWVRVHDRHRFEELQQSEIYKIYIQCTKVFLQLQQVHMSMIRGGIRLPGVKVARLANSIG